MKFLFIEGDVYGGEFKYDMANGNREYTHTHDV